MRAILKKNCACSLIAVLASKKTLKRLARLDLSIEDIGAILITHEHSDHSKGAISLASKYQIPLYITRGTWLELINRTSANIANITLNWIIPGEAFYIDSVNIEPVAVPHDARDPVQFIFRHADEKTGVLTDLGSVSKHVVSAYSECDTLLIEANHDLEMLNNGSYHYGLKKRVSGDWGHLNNQQTADLIAQINTTNRLKNLIVGHISQNNNSVDKVKATLNEITANIGNVHYACQNNGLDWVSAQ